jgi:PAS domain S-box-containing protein
MNGDHQMIKSMLSLQQKAGVDTTLNKWLLDKLAESENRYRAIVENQTEFICWFAPNGTLTFVNDAYCCYFGLDRKDCIGKRHTVVLPPEDDRQMRTHLKALTLDNPVAYIVHRIIMPSGEVPWQRWNDRAIFDESGTVEEYQSVGRDITDTIKAEQALRESEEHYRQLVEMSPDAILIMNDSKIMEINSAGLTLFGASSPRQLLGGTATSLVLPDFLTTYENWICRAITGKKPTPPIELKMVQFNGTVLDIEAAAVPITYQGRQAVQVVARDITQRKMLEDQVKNQQEILEKQVHERTIDLLRTNEQLKMEIIERKSMQEELTIASNEKDLLLREVHHRVKNNLQLIIGLIDMTKMRTHEPAITAVLTDIMAKIHTMGLIHSRLYESKRFDKINMKQQVTELVAMTSGFYSHEHCTIDFTIDCAEIYLPVDQAMPCALALNEVLSNIHKHAFKGRRSGVVEISSSRKYTMLRFVIRDNGVGLPKGFDIEQSNRLGLKLMRALVEQQLHGSVTIKSENGTSVVIEIPIAQAETDHGKSTRS